jgi:hypothetical protein
LLTSVKQARALFAPHVRAGLATGRSACHNEDVASNSQKARYVDPGWPATQGDDDHPVSELAADRTGALSPFGDLTFPLATEDVPYLHPVTVINK